MTLECLLGATLCAGGKLRLTVWYTTPLRTVKVAMQVIPEKPLAKPDQTHNGLSGNYKSPFRLLTMIAG